MPVVVRPKNIPPSRLTAARVGGWLAALLVCIAALSMCGKVGFGWNEEVALSSGETIVVKRHVRGRSLGELGGPGGWESDVMSVEIINPKRADVPSRWTSPFVPILMDRDAASGEWFMVVTFYTCERWEELGSPKLPYGQWSFRGGQWQRTELDLKLIGREANLLTKIRSSGEPDHTLGSKALIMSDRRIAPEYRQIFSEWKPVGCSKSSPVVDSPAK